MPLGGYAKGVAGSHHALAWPLAWASRKQQVDGEHQHEEDELHEPRGVGHHRTQLVCYRPQWQLLLVMAGW